MPVYNAGKTLRETIESVMAQTVSDWELIAIDDGSTDDTAQILAEFAAFDSRIHYLQNEKNSGVSYTRNRAVALAKGDWIAFLDSDDLWEPQKLERQLAFAQLHPDMVVCYTGSAFIDDDGNRYEYVLPAIEQLTYKILLRKNLMSCSSVLIRTSVMKDIKMPGDNMHEDYFVWLTVLRQHTVAYGINEPLLIYRLSAKSKSGNRFKSGKMLFHSYRAVGYGIAASCLLTFRYMFYSVSKRNCIYSSRKVQPAQT